MDNPNQYAVTDLVVRQSPLVGGNGQLQTTTTASFMVGAHGPFTLSWPGATPQASDIVAAIKAKVEELRSLGQAVQQINSRP